MTSDTLRPMRHRLASAAFAAYRHGLSPLVHGLGVSRCKFLPTCSEYAYAAVVKHGWLRGGWLAVKRVVRCRPFAEGGFDPVP